VKEKYRKKRIETTFEKLENCAIKIEGNDAEALGACGFTDVYEFGQIGQACKRIRKDGLERVAILTDIDAACVEIARSCI
jgi:5S rRNA maturation endonuclease (ribonuclease M5)